MKKLIFAFLVTTTFFACQSEPQTSETPQQRIVSLSGLLTETLFELGYGNQIVGIDVTSAYPAATDTLQKLGHVSQLNVEAILALQPTFIFVEQAQLAQAAALSQLKNSDIQIVPIATSYHLNNAVAVAKQLQKHLDLPQSSIDKMQQKIEADSLKLAEMLAATTKKPRVLFIYARGAGQLMVSGTGTAAEAIIQKAGGQNAITSFADFKPLTPEALPEAKPDVILMFESGLASLDGKAGLQQITGITQTPAFQNDRIVAMDGHYLTAFAPRIGEAAQELARKLHQKTK